MVIGILWISIIIIVKQNLLIWFSSWNYQTYFIIVLNLSYDTYQCCWLNVQHVAVLMQVLQTEVGNRIVYGRGRRLNGRYSFCTILLHRADCSHFLFCSRHLLDKSCQHRQHRLNRPTGSVKLWNGYTSILLNGTWNAIKETNTPVCLYCLQILTEYDIIFQNIWSR